MALSLAEMETVITYDRSGDMMNVYTAEPALMRKLKKLPAYRVVREHKQDGKTIAIDFEADKKLLTFRSKLQKGTLTPEQLEQASKRIQAYNNSK